MAQRTTDLQSVLDLYKTKLHQSKKWLRILGSNQVHGIQSPRYKPIYQSSICLVYSVSYNHEVEY